MVIVDTSVWIDYLGNVTSRQTEWLARELGRQPLGLTDIIFCEVLQGIRDDAAFAGVRDDLEKFYIFNSGGQTLALSAARNYRLLRSSGYTVRSTVDCLIATFCLHAGHWLLHHDRDFDPFERYLGLKVVRE